MRIRPRQEILDLWQAQLRSCYQEGEWIWHGHGGPNSISDAEQVLTLLYPVTEIGVFALDNPEFIADDVRVVLSPFGKGKQIGAMLLRILEDYYDRYTDSDGQPIFSAGGYLQSLNGSGPTENQLQLEVVDSYSMSLTLSIAALRFMRSFRLFLDSQVGNESKGLSNRIQALDPWVRVRLTLAMTGLLRSFVIHTPSLDDEGPGREIVRMVNQTGAKDEDVIQGLARRLDPVRVQLASEVRLGQVAEGRVPDYDLSDDTLLFECGWSWGIHKDSASIVEVSGAISSVVGVAAARPNPYFTIVALDGIADLISQRAREVDLLHQDQSLLADALKLRWELTQRYWSIVARYGNGRWPLRDMPWRTSGGEESVYYTLAITGLMLEDFVNRDVTNDIPEIARLLADLARRGCISSRVTEGDPGAALHYPGLHIRLEGSEKVDGGGPKLLWTVADFATLLLKRTLRAAGLVRDVPTRDELMELAVTTWEHIAKRRLESGEATGLWDNASKVVRPVGAEPDANVSLPSWYMTERVVECLVAAYDVYRAPTLSTQSMVNRAVELLNEADHLLNREQLEGPDADFRLLAEQEKKLDQARRMLREKPSTAFALAEHALLKLQEIVDARDDATRMR